MKIFFFGTPHIAIPALERLASLETVEIVGVGVFPDRKVGRKQVLMPCPVKEAAVRLGLKVVEIETKRDLKSIFSDSEFDMGLVIAFGMLFPESVLNIPPLGVVNVHFSLLPQYRGASPVQSAILKGEEVSGITFQRMVRRLDAGEVLWQQAYPLMGKTSEIFADYAEKTAELLPDFIDQYGGRSIVAQPQDEEAATFCGKFEKGDGLCDLKKETAEEIERKYRAFDLFPGIFVKTKKGNVKLVEVSLEIGVDCYPLECAGGSVLYVKKVQVPGKQVMEVADVLRGTPDLFVNF